MNNQDALNTELLEESEERFDQLMEWDATISKPDLTEIEEIMV